MDRLRKGVAAALLAVSGAAFAVGAVTAPEQQGSIAGRLLLLSYPGIPIAETLAPSSPDAGLPTAGLPELGAPSSRMDSVTIPGIAPRNKVADTVHWLLGAATVVAGGVTGILGGSEGEDEGGGGGGSLHHTLGYATAGLAAATLLSGWWAHHGDVGPADGFSAANVHALLGVAGGLMMMATPFVADLGGGGDEGGGHAALGMGGELLMGVAVIWPLVF